MFMQCLKRICFPFFAILLFLTIRPNSLSGQTTILSQDFGASSCSQPVGWTNTGGISMDYSTTDPGRGPGGDHTTGTGCYAQIDDSDGNGTRSLCTPVLDLSGTNPELSFWLFNNDGSVGNNSEYSTLTLTASTDGGSTFSTIDIYGDTQPAEDYMVWTEITASLLPYVSTTTVVCFLVDEGSSFNSDLSLDDILIVSNCAPPVAMATVVPDCNNTQFTIDVNVTNLGDGTAADISNDGGVATITNVGTGVTNIGPFAVGTDVVITIDGSSYGGCSTDLNSVTEACSCINAPVATASASTNCPTGLDISTTVTSFGDGTGADIYVDNVLVQSNAMLATPYVFTGYTLADHTVKVVATGGTGFVTCEMETVVTGKCNGANDCANASNFDVIADCQVGSFTDPSITFSSGIILDDYLNNGSCTGLNGGYVSKCEWGPSYATYDYLDIWYQADLPAGVDVLTLDITGLTGDEMVAILLYESGGCHYTAQAYPGASGQCNFWFDASTQTQTITGLTAGAVYDIRVLPVGKNGEACNAIDLPDSFTLCTPPPNDICGSASDINGLSQSGNLCNANTDVENNETCNTGNNCTACTEGNETNDLWYTVTFAGADQVLSVDLTFPNATDEVLVTLYSGCFSNSQMRYGPFGSEIADCAAVASTGAGSTVSHTFGSVLNAGDYYIRVSPTTGNAVCGFEIEGELKLENDDCDLFNQTLPIGYNVSAGSSPVDMTLATASDATGEFAGMKDLWYNINNNSNHQMINISMSDLGNWNGEMMLVLYEYPSSLSLDCENLVEYCRYEVTSTIDIELYNDITLSTYTPFSYTDINNADDGVMLYLQDGEYLLRVIETVPDAGGDQIDVDMTGILSTSFDPIASNSECSNAIALPATNQDMDDAGAACGDYDETDCDGIAYDTWSPVSFPQEYFAGPGKDLWYSFTIPATNCPTSLSSLENSTVISGATISVTNFLTDAGSNAIADIELHQATCGNRIECRDLTVTGGAGSVTFTGLDQDETYYVRVKRKGSNAPEQLFDIDFSLDYVSPCNDKKEDAYTLDVNDCPNYSSLLTFSALGANAEIPGERTVWFKFVAPDPANGNDLYFNPSKSWVSVFLEGVSGESIDMDLYLNGGTTQANGAIRYTVNGAGDRVWGKFGNLEPGDTYFIRLQHNETATTDVQYKIEINAEGEYTPWGCGSYVNDTSAKLCGSCGGTPEDQTDALCEEWYKIDLPPLTPGNLFWTVEVRGFDQVLDFELRSQYLTETSANVGGEDDYDHPCTSRVLEPAASLVSTKAVGFEVTPGPTYTHWGASGVDDIIEPLSSNSCEALGNLGVPQAGGFRRVYEGLNGPIFGQKDFYYLRVFMDPDDPQYTDCAVNGGIDIQACEVIFKGPYLTQAAAEAGGTPNVNLCTRFDYCDLSSDVYPQVFSYYTDEDGDMRSDDGVWLGALIDSENDSWGTGASILDDTNGDDEDGFEIIDAATPGMDATIRIIGNAIATGTDVHVGVWIDWDNSGDFETNNSFGVTEFYNGMGTTASPINIDLMVPVPALYDPTTNAFVRVMAKPTAVVFGDYATDILNGEIEGHRFISGNSITGTVFLDNFADGTENNLNGDGTGTDAGIQGITVTLLDCGANAICGDGDDGLSKNTTTDASGNYLFSGLADGNYAIEFGMNDGTTTYDAFTTQNTGGDTKIDSDADPLTGETATIVLGGGTKSAVHIDAGLYEFVTIEGVYYSDNDGTTGNTPVPNGVDDIVVTYCVDPPMCTITNDVTYPGVMADVTGAYSIPNVTPGVIVAINAVSTYIDFEDPTVINAITYDGHSGGIIISQNFALPIELISFKGRALDGRNELLWETATEENASHFEVQRLIEGTTNFEEVGKVLARGNTTTVQSYSFDHLHPKPLEYYRLKMVDLNGDYAYSDVISVQIQKGGMGFIRIAPNPTKNNLNITFEINEDTQIRVSNVAGKLVYSNMLTETHEGKLNLDVSAMAPGVYFISLSNDQNIITEKFVIMK